MDKFLIEIFLTLNNNKLSKNDEFNSEGYLIIGSYVIEGEKEKDNFVNNNIPIILKGIMREYKEIYKGEKLQKINSNDFSLRITPMNKIDFKFNLI